MTRVFLLTGATGHVGGELARRLAESGDVDQVIALVRTASRRTTAPGAERVHGDVTQPDLGLDPGVARRLARDVTDVVHAAADTRFLAAPQDLARTNVVGTERVLDFAARCPRLRKLTHVSTLYAVGLTPGRILEEPSTAREFGNGYQRSKRESPSHVLERTIAAGSRIRRARTASSASRFERWYPLPNSRAVDGSSRIRPGVSPTA